MLLQHLNTSSYLLQLMPILPVKFDGNKTGHQCLQHEHQTMPQYWMPHTMNPKSAIRAGTLPSRSASLTVDSPLKKMIIIISGGGDSWRWSSEAVETIKAIGRLQGQRLGLPLSETTTHTFQQLAIRLWSGMHTCRPHMSL